MFVDSYVTDSLEVDMPIGNHAWVYVLVLFGSLLLCTLYMTSFVRGKAGVRAKNTTKFAPAMMAVAMLGLCSFSYYANRAAYANLDIVMQLAGIAACMVWRAFRQNLFCRSGTRETCVKTIVAYVSLVLAMVLAIEAAVFSTPLLLRKYKYKHYDRSNYNQACAWLEESIPANTFAFGGGISWLYADLGWDTIGHYRDMSDMSVGGGAVKNTIVRDALSQDSFVAYLSTGREKEIVEQILMEAPEFVLIEETELNRKVLQYYVRSGDKGE